MVKSLSAKTWAGRAVGVEGIPIDVEPMEWAVFPSGNCTVRGSEGGTTWRPAVRASLDRRNVLLAPESAQADTRGSLISNGEVGADENCEEYGREFLVNCCLHAYAIVCAPKLKESKSIFVLFPLRPIPYCLVLPPGGLNGSVAEVCVGPN